MKPRLTLLLVLVGLMLSSSVLAESDFFRTFKDYYGEMGSELATKPPAELAEIKDFVYQKDVATFTFKSGRIYLLRALDGRPTTAIFMGEGHATINVPSSVERRSLLFASRDSLVDESFEIAFINFSDDFDLRLKEQFQFEKTVLPWRAFNRSQQGEFFFKPVIMHPYDNYFQLLRSLFDRQADGYFWIDFNRYCYTFDPNRPEEVVIGYEHEGGDTQPTDGAVMQRQEKAVYDDYRMSDISYPTTLLSRQGELELAGLDGKKIEAARIALEMTINVDSLRFISLFLHHNLKIDSMQLDGSRVDFSRRGSFSFTGVILPRHYYAGDTLSLTLFYHGKDYNQSMPFVEDPTPTTHDLTFDIHTGYNYIMPAMTPIESLKKGRTRFTSRPNELYRMFLFQAYASGYDTATAVSDVGISLNFLTSPHIDKNHFECFIKHEEFQTTTTSAFNFMTGRMGPPLATFGEYIYPEPAGSMPGFMGVSQTVCYTDDTGGLLQAAAASAARQYFGALMRPASDRENWLVDAMPDYLSLLCVWHEASPSIFFGEMGRRRNHIYSLLDLNEDQPLATGGRVDPTSRISKGSWVLHMLRFLMYDLDSGGDRDKNFWRFVNELKIVVNGGAFTNETIIKLAEKHYGESLDWFFHHWLFDKDIPEYKVEYRIVKRDGGHFIEATVRTEKVPADFKMPVIVRVVSKDGTQSIYARQMVSGANDSFEIGPFSFEPKEMVFNEFHSVLAKAKVKKK